MKRILILIIVMALCFTIASPIFAQSDQRIRDLFVTRKIDGRGGIPLWWTGFIVAQYAGTTRDCIQYNYTGSGNYILDLQGDGTTVFSVDKSGNVVSSGGVVSGGNGVFDTRAYGATGLGVADDSDAFDSAITAATASGGIVLVTSGTYKLSDDVLIPADVTLNMLEGALLSIDNTKTVTLADDAFLQAGIYQIFSGAGTVSIGRGVVGSALSEWWGAVGDGATDSTAAINAAFTAMTSGGRIILSAGTYILSGSIAMGTGNILEGRGWDTIINTAAITSTNDAITMAANSVVRDIKIVGDISPLTDDYHRIATANHTLVQRIWMHENCNGIVATSVTDVHIRDCYFTDIHSDNTWSSAVHVNASSNVFVSGIYCNDSDRGIEVENGSYNVHVDNVYLVDVPDMSLDVHSHDNEGDCNNISFDGCYLLRTAGLTASGKSAAADKTHNVSYSNITLEDQQTMSVFAHIYGVRLENIRVNGFDTDTTNHVIEINSNSEDVVISGLQIWGTIVAAGSIEIAGNNSLVENARILPTSATKITILVSGNNNIIRNVYGEGFTDAFIEVIGDYTLIDSVECDGSEQTSEAAILAADAVTNHLTIINSTFLGIDLVAIDTEDRSHTNTAVRNCYFQASADFTNSYLVRLEGDGIILDNCDFVDYRAFGGVWTDPNSANLVVSNNRAKASGVVAGGTGYYIRGTNAIIKNNESEDSATTAIRVDGTDIRVIGNYIDDDIVIENGVSNIDVTENNFSAGGITDNGGSGIRIWRNRGYVTENSGTATLVNGNTTIVVTHGISGTPVAGEISVDPIETLNNATFFWVDTITATQFTINVDGDPGQDVDFAWNIATY